MQASFKRIAGLASAYAVADALAKGVQFLLIPLYTAYLPREDYGVLGVFVATIWLLYHGLGLGMNSGATHFYYRFEETSERRRFYGTMWIALGLSAGFIILVMDRVGVAFAGDVFPNVPFDPHARVVLWTAWLQITFRIIPSAVFRVSENARSFLVSSLVTVFATLGFTVWYVVGKDMGLLGALLGTFHATLLAGMVTFVLMLRYVRPAFVLSHIKQAVRYGLPLVPHNLAHWVLGLSDKIIIGKLAGPAAVGLYYLGYQFASAFQVLIVAINAAVSPHYARAATDGRGNSGLTQLATYYVLVCAVIGLGITLLAPSFIELLTPPEYHDAQRVIPWVIAGVFMLGLYYVPMNFVTITAGRTGLVAPITLTCGAASIGLNVLFVPMYSFMAAAVTKLITYSLLFLGILWMKLRTDVDGTMRYELSRIGKILLAVGVIHLVSVVALRFGPWLDMGFGFLLWLSFPLVLWLAGFMNETELASVKNSLRKLGNRYTQ